MRILTGFQRALKVTSQIKDMRDTSVLDELHEYYQDLINDDCDTVAKYVTSVCYGREIKQVDMCLRVCVHVCTQMG